jgi:hypothetical protein
MKNTVSQEYRPNAATENLVTQQLQDEVLIYNLDTHRAMNLNKTAACVWNLCNGENTLPEIRLTASRELQTQVPEEAILLAIDALNKHNLLSNDSFSSSTESLSKMTRRAMIRKVGLTAAVSLPIITALIAPTAADAQSGAKKKADGTGCTTDDECQSGCCLGVCSPAGDCFI